jgi:MiaB-like tRNA modifying enzyme
MAKVYLEFYGCSSNKADYEIATGLLKESGFTISSTPENSDILVIFTCSVKIPTVNKILYRIKKLTELNKPILIAGCLPLTRRKIIEKINPNASLVSPDNVEKIAEVVKETLNGNKIALLREYKKPKSGLPRCRVNKIIGIAQIARGCLSNCSFCGEPYKGNLFSYPIENIVNEVGTALEDGCKEIWLTSLDNSCYGFDIGTNICELLNEISKIEGKFFVRIGMMNPQHFKKIGVNNLINSIKDEKFFKFLHLPLQSGSNKVLRLMNRDYDSTDFINLVEKIRREYPFLNLATDIIVGHPGEDEKDFEKTLRMLEKVEPDVVNVSKFAAHPGTQAEKMEKIPGNVIKHRSKIASELVKKISLKRNEKWVGWEGEVLIDEIGKGNTLVGRNFAYKPIVVKEKSILGKFVEVKVVDFEATHLIGEVIR